MTGYVPYRSFCWQLFLLELPFLPLFLPQILRTRMRCIFKICTKFRFSFCCNFHSHQHLTASHGQWKMAFLPTTTIIEKAVMARRLEDLTRFSYLTVASKQSTTRLIATDMLLTSNIPTAKWTPRINARTSSYPLTSSGVWHFLGRFIVYCGLCHE